MRLFCRLVEVLEAVSRLVRARGSHIAALEAFYRRQTPEIPPATGGVFDEDFAEAEPGLVSVIILTLHGADMLAALFKSLGQHNTWRQLEFIVVDHGGDEATAQVLAEAASNFSIRHLMPGRNFSFAFSCNRAAQIARGETVLFLNNDIEFTGDVIPGMVAAAQATKGLVGLKLWQKSPEGELAKEPEIGIRFRWNLHQGWTVPYETKPGPADALRAERPSVMPLVTAAILACSRENFLALGGFSEDYLYAYEDVDFGLKAAAVGLPSVSLNNRSATHIVGATRFGRARRARRRRWHRYNLSVFRARCGYRTRRLAWTGLFGGDGFDWGRQPAVAVIPPADGEPPVLGDISSFAFVSVTRPGIAGCNLYGYDLIICCDPSFDFSRARHLSPMAVRVGWATRMEGWSHGVLGYDLVVADDEALAAELAPLLCRPVETLGRGKAGEDLVKSVARFLKEQHRVVLVGGATDGRRDVLAAELRRRGMSVRCEEAWSYPSPRAMRDDFAIWLDDVEPATLPPDTCHITGCDIAENAPWRGDIHLGSWKGGFSGWFELLVREMEGYHSRRMAGPVDTPLASLVLEDDAHVASFWSGFPDPTEWLISSP